MRKTSEYEFDCSRRSVDLILKPCRFVGALQQTSFSVSVRLSCLSLGKAFSKGRRTFVNRAEPLKLEVQGRHRFFPVAQRDIAATFASKFKRDDDSRVFEGTVHPKPNNASEQAAMLLEKTKQQQPSIPA